ncbi:CHAT domain-containing protein [Actinoplanes sp. NPDC026619]|uniref:CHAT domain-containing protein n=1 Tax=Actinoplanes sp. NPDC026619 TaxID=3155798 RepID=UPI0033CE1B12
MYEPLQADAECDGCGRPMVLELRVIRNLEAEPEVLTEIRQGVLFDFVCGHCHRAVQAPHGLLVYHPRKLPVMLFVPPPGMGRRDSQWTGSDLAQIVRKAESMTETPHVASGTIDAIAPVIEEWMTALPPAAEEAPPAPAEELPDDLDRLFARIRDRLDPAAEVAGQTMQIDTSLAELRRARGRFGEAGDRRIAHAMPILEELQVAVELSAIEELIDPERGATPETLERALAQSAALAERAEGVQRAQARVYLGLARFKLDSLRGAESFTEAIATVESALPSLRTEEDPIWLVAALCNLGAMYWAQRHTGDREAWIERAVRVGEEALGLLDQRPAESPRDRARHAAVLIGLHHAYAARAAGDPAENEARGLQLAEQALAIVDPVHHPYTAAMIHNDIGMHYLRTRTGDRHLNIEQARAELELAVAGLRRERNPAEWAMVQINLGVCYQQRYAGNRAVNVEQAFTCFGNATAATREQTGRTEWAMARLGLATTMLERDLEPRARFEQQAIDLIEEVLGAVDGEHARAECHQQLATLYGRRVNRGAIEDAGRALEHGARAVVFYTRERDPGLWGVLRSGLSLVKAKMAEPDLPGALAYADEAIAALPPERYPFEWGIAQLNKAVVHQINNEPDLAVRHGELALEQLTPDRAPEFSARAADLLGECHAEAGRWPAAAAAFRTAINAFRYAYAESARSSARTTLFRQAGVQHTSAAYAEARAGNLAQAVALAEAGRAFALREALELDPATVDASVDPESAAYQHYLSALAAVRAAESAVRAPWLAHARTTAPQARLDDETRKAELESARRVAAAARAALTTAAPVDVAAIRGYATGVDAVVYLLSTTWGTVLLSLRPGTGEIEKREHPFTHQDLSALLFHSDGPGHGGGLLVGAMTGGEPIRQAIADLRRSAVADWLRDALRGLGTALIVPMGPWSAVPFSLFAADGSVLIQAVSAEVRHHCRTRLARESGRPSGVLAYGDPSLPLAAREVETLGRVVPAGPGAKDELLAALPDFDRLHLATHGIYRLDDPAESAILIGGQELRLRELIERQLLNGVRLAFLSACQTGVSDILSARDEVVGLPSACIYSGAIGVVGTLWPVDDAATFLFVRAFYRECADATPPVALARAREWLRDATAREILQQCDGLPPELDFLRFRVPADRPFGDPYFWAPFIYVGA